MVVEIIKGNCEHCGFNHTGDISHNGVFPILLCPNCGKVTQNWETADIVDLMEKHEKVRVDYKDSVYKIIHE